MKGDRPRLLRDRNFVTLRRAELSQPHIRPLAEFVISLRQRDLGEVPDFDPWDGGVQASALFLFEKPGPKAFASGFISRNNDDQTAENTFRFMDEAGIPRSKTCIWNIIPGWNGTIKLTSMELIRGAEALRELLALMAELRVVVLVGRRAADAWKRIGRDHEVPTIEVCAPSPKNYALAREKWAAIPRQWGKVRDYLQ